jgi:hypothetical protein
MPGYRQRTGVLDHRGPTCAASATPGSGLAPESETITQTVSIPPMYMAATVSMVRLTNGHSSGVQRGLLLRCMVMLLDMLRDMIEFPSYLPHRGGLLPDDA